jgi:hypothetical protein
MSEETTRRPVRMSFEEQDTTDPDQACQLVGRFRRKAREQGWTEEAIEQVNQGLKVDRVASQLSPHIETTGPEPLTWRTQFERNRDYAEGGSVLVNDQAVRFRPLHFLARGLRLALRGKRR